MNTTPLCPSCGKPLAPSAPKGLCQECLLKAAFPTGTQTDPNDPTLKTSAFVPPTPEELGAKFPQLEVLELLGRGGMGAVYKARQKQLDRVVALKILPPAIGDDPAFAERFMREAKALAKLNHPNVVVLYEFGQADGLFYFLMEFVDGLNLRQLLEVGRVSPRDALAIVPQICDALQYAHDHGIVHRDIKPENILMDRRGRVKVADFGLAKLMGADATSSFGVPPSGVGGSGEVTTAGQTTTLTDAGKVMGTPQYMAPEQIATPMDVDHRADIYALGVVFYQMLTGELPGKRIEAPSKKVRIDVRLDEIVLRALEKNPERRYEQASVFKTDLETIASSSAGGSQQEATSKSHYNPWELRITVIGTLFLIGMLFVAADLSPVAGRILFVSGVIGLSICGLTFAGLWPLPSPWFPRPNFSSRNLSAESAGADRSLKLFALCPVLTYAGAFCSYLLFALFRGHVNDGWLIAVFVSLAVVTSLFAMLARHSTHRAMEKWFRAGRWLSIFVSIPVIALAGFCLISVAGDSHWSPSPMEAVMAGLFWIGALLLPVCGWILWREPNEKAVATQGGSGFEKKVWIWVGVVVLFAGGLAVFLGNRSASTRITGIVTDAITGQPIAGANVLIRRMDLKTADSTVISRRVARTDAAGRYRLSFPPNAALDHRTEAGVEVYAQLTVEAHRDGYAPGFADIMEVTNGKVDFSLRAAPPSSSSLVAAYQQGTVELVALAPHPTSSGPSWLADGSRNPDPFPAHNGKASYAGRVMKEICFRVNGQTPSFPTARYSSGVLGQGGSFFSETNPAVRTFIQRIACEPNAKQIDVMFGVADGPWEEDIVLLAGPHGSTSQSREDGTWTATFQSVVGKEGDVAVSYGYSRHEKWETRMVPIMKDGTVGNFKSSGTDGTGGLIRGIASFSAAEFAAIREFQLQRRKYQWVQFRNVSLQLGHRTSVYAKNARGAKGGGGGTRQSNVRPGAITTPGFSTATFDREVAMTMPDLATNIACVLDFESGKLLVPPHEVANALAEVHWDFAPSVVRWLRDNGADAFVREDGSIRLIDGVVLSPQIDERPIEWQELNADMVLHTAQSVSEESRQASASQPKYNRISPRAPAAFYVLTRERSAGVFQILGPSENPRGLKVRYKLIRKPGAVTATPGAYKVTTNGVTVPSVVKATNTSTKAPVDAIGLTVQAEGKPLPSFRVIAGVAVNRRDSPTNVINWQPHTLRLGTNGTLSLPLDRSEMALRIESDGYRPTMTPFIVSTNFSVTLVKDPGVQGRIFTPEGQPAAGATLALAMVQRDAVLENGALRFVNDAPADKPTDQWRRPVFVTADNDGRFSAPDLNDPTAAVLIVHESGVRELPFSQFEKMRNIELQPWGRIEGQVLWQQKPGAYEEITLTIYRDEYGYPGVVAQYEKTRTDSNGRFVFEKVLPGRTQVSIPFSYTVPGKGSQHIVLPGLFAHVTVGSGQPTQLLLGGRGRSVIGRLAGRTSWEGVTMRFHPRAPHIGMPGDEDHWKAWGEFQNSELGLLYFRGGFQPKADGTFEIPGVLPGDYQFFVGTNAYRSFTAERELAGMENKPVDIGVITVK